MNMREIMRIAESATPRVLYHVTPTRNLAAIKRDGLVPKIGVRSRKLGETLPAIYLFPSMAEVEDALTGWLADQFGETVRLALLAVNVPAGADVQAGAGYERLVSSTIPADSIRVLSKDVLGEVNLSSLR